MFSVSTNSQRNQFDCKKGTDKKGSLVCFEKLEGSYRIGRVPINYKQINFILID